MDAIGAHPLTAPPPENAPCNYLVWTNYLSYCAGLRNGALAVAVRQPVGAGEAAISCARIFKSLPGRAFPPDRAAQGPGNTEYYTVRIGAAGDKNARNGLRELGG